MVSVKINGYVFDNAYIEGRVIDSAWDSRESKSITLSDVTLQNIVDIFKNDTPWSILITEVQDIPVVDDNGHIQTDENGEIVIQSVEHVDEYDNSEYSMLGDITIHPDGSVTVKMGKLTELETAYMQLIGGV